MEAKQKMTRARTELILDHPFFASIIFSMPMVEDSSLPTMAVDGKNIYYNPTFVDMLELPEVVFVLCHEAMHCAMSHFWRRGSRDHRLWNIACDYVINEHLVRERVGRMPSMGLRDTDLFDKGDGMSEGVYDLLVQEGQHGQPGQESKPGERGEALDDVKKPGPGDSEADLEQQKQDMAVRVAQAAHTARAQGKLSAGISRLVEAALNPQMDWRELLRRFVASKAKIDYTFARPKRRFAEADFYLPTLTGQSVGPIAVFSDFSGSVSQEEAAQWFAELRSIIEDTQPERVMAGYFHHSVFGVDVFEKGEEFQPRSTLESGGTAFSPIFQTIEAEDFQPVACIVLTDLECSDFGPEPDYPVLWVSTLRDKAPFGEVALMKSTQP